MKNLSRRSFVAGAASLLASMATGQNASYGTREWQPRTYDDGLIPRFSFEVICLQVDGGLGVSVLDTETGRASGWDETSTYPLNSTFKLLLAGAVLQRVDRGQEGSTGRSRFDPRILSRGPRSQKRRSAAA